MTSANKPAFYSVLLILACLLTSWEARAEEMQGIAPALYGVSEIQVQYGRIGNPKASANCGTSSGEVLASVLKSMEGEGLPAFSVLHAPQQQETAARVNAYPDVITLQPRDKECISWVALTVSSREPLQINPIGLPRNLTTTYWTGGLMVGSPASAHAASINEAFQKLVEQFGRQYRADQPPDLTPQEATSFMKDSTSK
ncbi:MAG: hypothetical protein PHW63_01260 [Alphaproteobacteria bacterium]|nr:hypothetical protein [Alphaproteobacteria bacterium]